MESNGNRSPTSPIICHPSMVKIEENEHRQVYFQCRAENNIGYDGNHLVLSSNAANYGDKFSHDLKMRFKGRETELYYKILQVIREEYASSNISGLNDADGCSHGTKGENTSMNGLCQANFRPKLEPTDVNVGSYTQQIHPLVRPKTDLYSKILQVLLEESGEKNSKKGVMEPFPGSSIAVQEEATSQLLSSSMCTEEEYVIASTECLSPESILPEVCDGEEQILCDGEPFTMPLFIIAKDGDGSDSLSSIVKEEEIQIPLHGSAELCIGTQGKPDSITCAVLSIARETLGNTKSYLRQENEIFPPLLEAELRKTDAVGQKVKLEKRRALLSFQLEQEKHLKSKRPNLDVQMSKQCSATNAKRVARKKRK